MASEIQAGTAVVHGITNSGSAITITGFATFLFDSAKGQHMFDIADVKDAVNFDAAAIATNEHIELDINFTPSGATRAAAAAVYAFPTPLSKVTLATFKITAFNGDWQYRGGTSIDLTNTGPGKISSLKIRKYADSTQNASLTTTVSG
jgi:hypothetical protein